MDSFQENRLREMIGQEKKLWREVEKRVSKEKANLRLIVTKLQELKDIAALSGSGAAFRQRLAELTVRHAERGGLIKRIKDLKLLDSG